jgi:AcrR family transcriptional regulator
MTRDDIIAAAFKVWGRELYQTTSLTDIAAELGVSKPALYRHFLGKDALLEAMYSVFFDAYAASIRADYERALAASGRRERYMIMLRAVTDYFLRNRDAFLFSLVRVYGNHEIRVMGDMLRSRGIDMERLARPDEGGGYPSVLQFINTSLVFWVACFHRYVHPGDDAPAEDVVRRAAAQVEERIAFGLGIPVGTVVALDYAALEARAAGAVCPQTEDDALLRAVAGAVAEAGPWNASMEMVARRSGLSKSTLYTHFKNKQDMMSRLFLTEFERIAAYAGGQAATSAVSEERLYLIIISVMEYLRSRPEIMVALNWIKTRRLELGVVEVPPRLYEMITELPFEFFALHSDEKERIAQLVLFLIVNTLMWRGAGSEGPPAKPVRCLGKRKATPPPPPPESGAAGAADEARLPNESIRLLFRYISCGLEGLIT